MYVSRVRFTVNKGGGGVVSHPAGCIVYVNDIVILSDFVNEENLVHRCKEISSMNVLFDDLATTMSHLYLRNIYGDKMCFVSW